MSRLRSLSFPRFSSPKDQEDHIIMPTARAAPGDTAHSRSSSGASSVSTPLTPTFSNVNRSHSRWPSSTSSLGSAPDSPVNVNKSALHDVAEDPAERDDSFDGLSPDTVDEPLCICDVPRCKHRYITASPEAMPSHFTQEWIPGDDSFSSFSNSELGSEQSFKRRRSGDFSSTDSFASRLSRRFPSVSKRWKDPKPTTAVSHTTVRSAPPSRTPSLHLPSFRRSVTSNIGATMSAAPTPPYSPTDSQYDDYILSRPRALSRSQKPMDIVISEPMPDPIDRQELASTPLLPPMMNHRHSKSDSALQSPLQSPSIAGPSTSASCIGTPAMTPVMGAFPTPPLSSKPSMASVNMTRSYPSLYPASEIPPMNISDEPDEWSDKLGHANFHIYPEPYLPDTPSPRTSKRLLDDWARARAEFTRQAQHIEEHYGPTSDTYRYTQAKWAAIDARWRDYHERVRGADDEKFPRTLAAATEEETRASAAPLVLNAEKFPQSEIVGPMVKYDIIRSERKRNPPGLLKLFTDPASLLGLMKR